MGNHRGLVVAAHIARKAATSYVEDEDGCYLSTLHRRLNGYSGVAWSDAEGKRHTTTAHRAAFQHFAGRPANGDVDHLCHDPIECPGGPCKHRACVRESHLGECSERENALRSNGVAATNTAKTSCPRCQGRYRVQPNGKRTCPPCKNENRRARRMRATN